MPEREGDRGIRTYVLRAGRMTDSQRRALEDLSERYILPFPPGGFLEYDSIFGGPGPVVMEIGFGMGQATWRIAKEHPSVRYLGVEVHTPGVGRLLHDLEAAGIGNVRIIHHDVVPVLERAIPPDSLAGYHIFYPDPWPKKRHHKRRLIRPGLTELLVSRLVPGGYLYFVTDIEDYAQSALEVLTGTPGLRNRYGDFSPPQEWRPETRFEARAKAGGRSRRELMFERV